VWAQGSGRGRGACKGQKLPTGTGLIRLRSLPQHRSPALSQGPIHSLLQPGSYHTDSAWRPLSICPHLPASHPCPLGTSLHMCSFLFK
jgi:hypothetical protein